MLDLQTPEELAYLAGLIDGEGCFSVGDNPRLRIVLQSRDKFALERIQEIFGGRLNHRKPQASWKPNCSDQWEWTVQRQEELYALCVALLPYLHIKREKCQQVVEILSTKRKVLALHG